MGDEAGRGRRPPESKQLLNTSDSSGSTWEGDLQLYCCFLKHKSLRARSEMVSKLVHSKSVWGILTTSLWISPPLLPSRIRLPFESRGSFAALLAGGGVKWGNLNSETRRAFAQRGRGGHI